MTSSVKIRKAKIQKPLILGKFSTKNRFVIGSLSKHDKFFRDTLIKPQ
jgi:hypothetical protein